MPQVEKMKTNKQRNCRGELNTGDFNGCLTNVTEEKINKFFEVLAQWPNVSKAALAAGISRETIYRYRRENPEFERRFAECRLLGVDVVEDEAFDRTQDSDLMRIFMLKGNKRERYGDKIEQKIEGNITVDFIGWGNRPAIEIEATEVKAIEDKG